MKIVKSITAFILAAALCFLCGCADVSNVKVKLGHCDKFTEEQIQDAAQTVINHFKYNLEGTLETVEYDKELTETPACIGYVQDLAFFVSYKNPDGEDVLWEYFLKYENNSWEIITYGY